tara:strand:- start:2633 stop:3001 length:369 start_codon:yes stop_codon:yes gene_type:complete
MKLFAGIAFLAFFAIYIASSIRSKEKEPKDKTLIKRFRNRFKDKNRLRERITEEFTNSLVSDPEANILIGTWYTEVELREKADIHRARLNKYGKSKINGEMLFLGPKGGVYKYTSDGKKKYL